MTYLVPLSEALETAEVGGKATGLSRLISYGVKVPKGFVVKKKVLKQYIVDDILPDDFIEELEACTKKLSGSQVIVRSSGIGEDSKSHSFAGQLDSFVVAHDQQAIQSAILKCWEGLKNERFLAYQAFSGHILSEMGVVIQEYLEADYAGVTFTQSPNEEQYIYTEYVKGASEALVAGKVTPQSFSLYQDEPLAQALPFNGQLLINQSKLLKEKFGYHLDIEWVAVANEIYFVQARPITVKKVSRVHWTNTNLNENYPDPISPLLYSVARDSYYHYFKNLAKLLQINKDTIRFRLWTKKCLLAIG